jgi:DNA-binding transcriptional LysR family regulator
VSGISGGLRWRVRFRRALSTGISKLERELAVPIVHRSHRNDDLAPEGQTLLRWARQVQTGVNGISTEAALLRGALTGTLRWA